MAHSGQAMCANRDGVNAFMTMVGSAKNVGSSHWNLSLLIAFVSVNERQNFNSEQ
jgi:hypothetical protein